LNSLVYGVTVTLPRRARTTLGFFCALLLGGLLGLFLWGWWRHRPARQRAARFGRVGTALVVAGVVTIAVGAAWRLSIAIDPLPSCSPPGGTLAATHPRSVGVSVLVEKAATWPETGIGLLYAEADGAKICSSTTADFYVGVPGAIAGTRATNLGDIVLSPGYNDQAERVAIASHEAQHRPQWAVATLLGGPLAFPVAYGIDDFFFPGPRNHFERLAGLESGGYRHVGYGPVLGPAQIAVLGVLAAIAVVVLLRVWHRRRSASSRAPDSKTDSA
jgi:hypothetical protein